MYEMTRVLRRLAICAALTAGAATACTPIADRNETPPSTSTSQAAENNEFVPADNELSSCVGLVERPGCGSKSRSSWMTALTFAILIAALSFIGWRIARGVRANERISAGVGDDT
jgi:hypothetical protein